jgi:hypothetical protein
MHLSESTSVVVDGPGDNLFTKRKVRDIALT